MGPSSQSVAMKKKSLIVVATIVALGASFGVPGSVAPEELLMLETEGGTVRADNTAGPMLAPIGQDAPCNLSTNTMRTMHTCCSRSTRRSVTAALSRVQQRTASPNRLQIVGP